MFHRARAVLHLGCTDVSMTRTHLPTAPARIARLPLSRSGIPIIAVVKRARSGRADFAQVCNVRKMVLGIFDLCGICGLPLRGERVSPMTGDASPRERTVSLEAPLHEVCAAYAVQVCPYLVNPSAVIRRGPAAGTPSLGMQLVRHAATTHVEHTSYGVGFGLSMPLETFSFTDAAQRYETLLVADTDEPVPASFAPVLALVERPDPITLPALAALHVSCMSSLLHLSPDEEAARAVARANVAGDRQLAPDLTSVLRLVETWLDDCSADLPYIISNSRARLNEHGPAVDVALVPTRRSVGRNEPCPCGSGMKYKRCHGHSGRSEPLS